MANVERLIEAREWALAHPEELNMSTWIELKFREGNHCGTVMCMAGYGASRLRETLIQDMVNRVGELTGSLDHQFSGRWGGVEYLNLSTPNSTTVCLSEMAKEWFGLSSSQAHDLFYATRPGEWKKVIDSLIDGTWVEKWDEDEEEGEWID